jgi:hypothetical protein
MRNNPTRDETDPSRTLRTTWIVYTASTFSMALLLLGSLVIQQYLGSPASLGRASATWLPWLAGFVLTVALLWSRKHFNGSLQNARAGSQELLKKLKVHRQALVRYLAAGDIIIVFNTVLFLLTAKFVFIIYGAVMLGAMLAVAPLKRRIIIQLELDASEQEQIGY